MFFSPLQWVGSSCGLHGPYIFYKAFKFNRDGKPRILSLGDFFFVRCKPEDPICIAELQLLWEERTSKQLLSSSKLYFLPEDTPQGRTVTHGEVGIITSWRLLVFWLFFPVFAVCVCLRDYLALNTHIHCIKSWQWTCSLHVYWCWHWCIRAARGDLTYSGICSAVFFFFFYLSLFAYCGVNCWMCTCPAALNKAAAALYGVNCVIKEEEGGWRRESREEIRKNPAPRLRHFISW